MNSIFISYRRSDALVYADRLQEELGEHFGPDEVFRDMDTITIGSDFVEAIDKALNDAEVMLVMIGPKWLATEGRRRLNEPDDFVRIEIAAGLQRPDVRVIPVLVGGATMPSEAELPRDISTLTRRHAFEMTDRHWRRDRAELLDNLDNILGVDEGARQREKERREREEAERREREEAERRRQEEERREREEAERRRSEEEERKAREAERRRRLRRAAPWAAMVLAAAVGAVLLVVLLRPDSEPEPQARGEFAWERADAAALGGSGEQTMLAIVNPVPAGFPSYVAGGVETPAGDEDAAIWTSEDGRAWNRADGEGFGGSGDQVITTVTYVKRWDLLVAGGMNGSDAALWLSEDGADWAPASGDTSSPDTVETLNRINGTHLGLVGAGSQSGDGFDGEAGAVWVLRTPDGTPEQIASIDGPGDQRINRVVELADGSGYIAAGFDDGDAAVWFSETGDDWEPMPADSFAGDGDQEILDAAAFGDGAMAVGRDGLKGAVWLSQDGRTWSRAPDGEGALAAGEQVQLDRVFVSESEDVPPLVVGGSVGSAAAVWTSPDGRVWAREPESQFGNAGQSAITALTAKSLPVIAVGWSQVESDREAAVWVGESSG
jgi:TIR domain